MSIRESGEVIRQMNKKLDEANSKLEVVQKQHDAVNNLSAETQQKRDEANSKLVEIQKQLDAVNNLSAETQQKRDEANSKLVEIQKQHDAVNNLSTETQQKRNEADSQLVEIQKQHDAVNNLSAETQQKRNEADSQLVEIQKQHDAVNNLSTETQQKRNEANSNLREIQNQLKTANEQIETSEKMRSNFDQLTNNVEDKKKEVDDLIIKVEELLPGVTAETLASEYKQAYSESHSWYYWVGFLLSLVVLLSGYWYFLIRPFLDDATLKIPPVRVLVCVTTGLPLIWIAWYCQRSISQMKRIREEYNHKLRIMTLYDGFSKQIDKLENNQSAKLQLVQAIITAVSKNPAETLGVPKTILDVIKYKNQINDPTSDQPPSSGSSP